MAADSTGAGPEDRIRHIVGADLGGAGEWTNPSNPAVLGVLVIELSDGLVSGLTAVWDGTLVDADSITNLVIAAHA